MNLFRSPNPTINNARERNSEFQADVGTSREIKKGEQMQDPAKFRRYAEDCRRLAKNMPEEYRRTLLEIADAWTKCAQDIESEATKKKDSPHKDT